MFLLTDSNIRIFIGAQGKRITFHDTLTNFVG
jgi:hypothetical protein